MAVKPNNEPVKFTPQKWAMIAGAVVLIIGGSYWYTKKHA